MVAVVMCDGVSGDGVVVAVVMVAVVVVWWWWCDVAVVMV